MGKSVRGHLSATINSDIGVYRERMKKKLRVGMLAVKVGAAAESLTTRHAVTPGRRAGASHQGPVHYVSHAMPERAMRLHAMR
jgi:hypothetical protein